MPAAPQHRPLPRLLEVHGEGPQMHHPGDGTDDVGHAQNVRIGPKIAVLGFFVICFMVKIRFSK